MAINQDPWIREDDEAEAAEPATQVAPEPAEPVAPKITDPVMPSLVLPKPETKVESKSPSASTPPDFSQLPTDPKEIERLLHGRKPPFTEIENELRRRYFAMQQGMPVIHIDLNEFNAERGRYISASEKKRHERIARLEAAIEKDDWLPMLPERVLSEGLIAFLSKFDALQIVTNLRRALANYEVALLKNFIWHTPNGRHAEHRHALSMRPTDEIRDKILQESQLLTSKHFRSLASAKRAELHNLFNETVKPQLLALLDAALLFVIELKLEAISAEIEFCEQNGNVRWQPTPVSARFDGTLAQLRSAVARIKNPNPNPVVLVGYSAPAAETELWTIFALPILPPAVESDQQ